MSARDEMAKTLVDFTSFPGGVADEILETLTAAGYRIVGPGEVDGETLERAAFVADTLGNGTGNNKAIAKAIRALAKGEEG